ncbi:hypothetical protein HG535_0F02730 [Zygotorulaspora mrakii]|uniref:t-SNARE coiled-coil homology domain-containing protein n=1 Tax=Zygotorulaspora mrakii TaxID=42260 RepID=A0A7H9B7Q2_ZYGMR|nr:uncharacterized protein HG535_0F02730 [Zygotorulaspora mrakii]QLG73762.1 hypothetical protein HG535_0F02730 [Zygotorulaspora mrakii]
MNAGYVDNTLHQRDTNRTRLFAVASELNPEANKNTDYVSPYVSKSSKKGMSYSQNSLAQLESQSDEQVGLMGQKLQALKSLSLKMGEEIRGSNQTIDTLGDTFQNTASKLKKTFGNMMTMARNSKINIKTWLLIFLLVGLLFFWVWIT